MELPRLLVFDMDGVLADVSQSYRRAVIATADYYLHDLLGAGLPDGGLFSLEHVDLLKRAGGFNNDWDAAAGLIAIALSVLPPLRPARTPSYDSFAPHRRPRRGLLHEQTIPPVSLPVFEELCRVVTQAGGGLTGLRTATRDTNSHLLLHTGPVLESDLVTRVFQEIYLGGKTFREIYGRVPRFLNAEGLAAAEPIFISPLLIRRLADRFQLGIATGRPRQEAAYFLRRHGIHELFPIVVTEDDVAEAEVEAERTSGVRPAYRKPHPWSLLRAMGLLSDGAAAYLGDTPDDLRAAKDAAKVRPVWAVGCLWAAPDPELTRAAMQRVGADRLLERPKDLLDWLGLNSEESAGFSG